jgi:hypothetical protein
MKKALIVMLAILMLSTALYAQNAGIFAVGIRGGLAFGFHELENDDIDGVDKEPVFLNPNVAVYGAYAFTDNVALQAELNFMINQGLKLKFSESGVAFSTEYTYTSLDIPILLKYSFDFGLGLLAGPHISIPLGKISTNVSYSMFGYSGSEKLNIDPDGVTFGLTGGLFYGFPLGPGRLIGDLRFVFDFMPQKGKYEDRSADILSRRALALTIGYEFSF